MVLLPMRTELNHSDRPLGVVAVQLLVTIATLIVLLVSTVSIYGPVTVTGVLNTTILRSVVSIPVPKVESTLTVVVASAGPVGNESAGFALKIRHVSVTTALVPAVCHA